MSLDFGRRPERVDVEAERRSQRYHERPVWLPILFFKPLTCPGACLVPSETPQIDTTLSSIACNFAGITDTVDLAQYPASELADTGADSLPRPDPVAAS